MASIETKCNKCKHDIQLKAQDLLTYTDKCIEAQYFKCERCKEIHITSVIDDHINKLEDSKQCQR